MKVIIVLLLVAVATPNNSKPTLSTINFPKNTTSANAIPDNFAGLSISFPQVYKNALLSSEFQGYLRNSWVFGSSTASWGVSIKMQWPIGYKYDCPWGWYWFAPKAKCTVNTYNLLSDIGLFLDGTVNSEKGVSVGFDRELMNFTNADVMDYLDWNYYYGFLFDIYFACFNCWDPPESEVFDKVDIYNANKVTPATYTPA